MRCILGLKISIDLKVECLKEIGDYEIITRHLQNIIHCLSPHLKNYQQEVWSVIYSFKDFDVKSILRTNSVFIETLANVVARFTPLRFGYYVEIIYKPVVPDNVTNLHVFNDDQQILNFMG